MLSAQSAARVDASTGAVHCLGALARWTTRRKVITAEHASILLGYAALAAVPPMLFSCCSRWYIRRRVPIVACVRLALALCLAVPLPIPDDEPASVAGFLWHMLLSGHSVYMALLSIGLPLPPRLHASVAVFQACCLFLLASARCGLLLAHPNRPASLFVGRAASGATFRAMGAALDWPFHLLAPGTDMAFANEQAACWTCTAWMQLVVSVVLPTALLLSGRRSMEAPRVQEGRLPSPHERAAGAAAGAGTARDSRLEAGPAASKPTRGIRWLLAWLDEALRAEPLLMSLYAAEAVWLLLRAASGLLLER